MGTKKKAVYPEQKLRLGLWMIKYKNLHPGSTQKEVAETLIHYSEQTVSHYFSGTTKLPADRAEVMAKAVEWLPEYLTCETNFQTQEEKECAIGAEFRSNLRARINYLSVLGFNVEERVYIHARNYYVFQEYWPYIKPTLTESALDLVFTTRATNADQTPVYDEVELAASIFDDEEDAPNASELIKLRDWDGVTHLYPMYGNSVLFLQVKSAGLNCKDNSSYYIKDIQYRMGYKISKSKERIKKEESLGIFNEGDMYRSSEFLGVKAMEMALDQMDQHAAMAFTFGMETAARRGGYLLPAGQLAQSPSMKHSGV